MLFNKINVIIKRITCFILWLFDIFQKCICPPDTKRFATPGIVYALVRKSSFSKAQGFVKPDPALDRCARFQNHLGPLLEAVRTKDAELVHHWSKSEEWSTVEQLMEADGRSPLSSRHRWRTLLSSPPMFSNCHASFFNTANGGRQYSLLPVNEYKVG